MSNTKLSKHDKELLSRAVIQIESSSTDGLVELFDAVRARVLLDYPKAVTLLGTLLHLAAARANLPAVVALLDAGAEVNSQGFRDVTPLMSAAGAGALSVVRRLIESGADVMARDSFGQIALHHATGSILAGLPVLELLLAAGSDPNARENSGRTPLHKAVGVVDPQKVELLLKAGSDPLVVADGDQGDPLRYLHETVRDLPSTKPGQRSRCAELLRRWSLGEERIVG